MSLLNCDSRFWCIFFGWDCFQFGKIVNTKKRKLRELREKLQQQLDGEASVEKDDKDDTTTDEDWPAQR